MTRLRTSLLMAFGVLGAACSAQGNNAMIVMNIAVPNGEDCTYEPTAQTFSDQACALTCALTVRRAEVSSARCSMTRGGRSGNLATSSSLPPIAST